MKKKKYFMDKGLRMIKSMDIKKLIMCSKVDLKTEIFDVLYNYIDSMLRVNLSNTKKISLRDVERYYECLQAVVDTSINVTNFIRKTFPIFHHQSAVNYLDRELFVIFEQMIIEGYCEEKTLWKIKDCISYKEDAIEFNPVVFNEMNRGEIVIHTYVYNKKSNKVNYRKTTSFLK